MVDEERKQAQRLWSRFAELAPSHAAVQALVHASQRRRLAPGAVLVSEGEEDATVFLVVSGVLRVVKHTANGHEVWYADMKTGDLTGDMAALTGGRRTSTVIARNACTLLEISKESFVTVANNHADFAFAVARMLARRLEATSAHLAKLASLPVSTRLHGELATLGSATRGDGESFEISSPPNVTALSQRIHATREATSRALGELERRGLLQRGKEIWTVIVPTDADKEPLS